MRKVLFLLLIALTAAGFCFAGGAQESAAADEGAVTLTMGSWRTDDVQQMKAVFQDIHDATSDRCSIS